MSSDYSTLKFLLALIAAVVLAATALYFAPFRNRDSLVFRERMGILLLAIASFWMGSMALELKSPSLNQKIFWDTSQYVVIVFIPTVWLISILRFAGQKRLLKPLIIIPLIAIPYVSAILVLTNSFHHLVWSNPYLIGSQTEVGKTFHEAYWLFIVYSYLVVILSSIVLIRMLILSGIYYRRQAFTLLGAVGLVVVVSIYEVTQITSSDTLDLTAYSFGFTSWLISIYLIRMRKADLVAISQDVLVRQMEDPLLVLDPDSYLIQLNPAGNRVLKNPDQQLLEEICPQINQALADNSEASTEQHLIELEVKGETRIFDVIASPHKDADNRLVGSIVVLRDITKHEALQRRIQHVQKHEALGTMASGIAHDFNNMVGAMLNCAELALLEAEDGSAVKENLNDITTAGKRAISLSRQILTFARKVDEKRQLVVVSRIAKEALRLLQASVPPSVKLNMELNCDATVMGNPTQIHQIIMNLCTNAFHSMEQKGGILAVTLESTVNQDGPQIRLRVRDSGSGMAPEIMDKIFDPYFTTKEQNKGTGLGLAVIKGIVESHQGTIHVQSTPETGTTFDVFLPVASIG